MNSPILSVILTVFDRENFLPEAIKSVLAQDYSDFEVLVADDLNSLATKRTVESFSDPRVVHCPTEHTLGVAGNVRSSLVHCRGKYIAILNDDDTWKPNFLSRCLKIMERYEECNLVFCNHEVIDLEGKKMEALTKRYTNVFARNRLVEGPIENLLQKICINNVVPLAVGTVFRKSAINHELIRDRMAGAYDHWISLCVSSQPGFGYFLPDYLTCYRIHDLRASSNNAKQIDALIAVYCAALESDFLKELHSHLRGKLHRSYITSAISYAKLGDRKTALHRSLTGLNFQLSVKGLLTPLYVLLRSRGK